MNKQLAIDVPVDHNANATYASAYADYIKAHEQNTYLCYCSTTKNYFVSRHFKKESIIAWYSKTIIIIQ